jgi:hypothetical protein
MMVGSVVSLLAAGYASGARRATCAAVPGASRRARPGPAQWPHVPPPAGPARVR